MRLVLEKLLMSH